MNSNKKFKIYLKNSAHYQAQENQHNIWREVKALCEAEKLSREGLLDAMSLLFAKPDFEVFIPLCGDIEGYQHYLIPSIDLMGSGRWVSYFLQEGDDGNPKHSPVRLSERCRMFHLFLELKQLRKAGLI
ncbi:hypothetical protein [Alteromonas sp. a30]|uniref:hypothetical protein n=1 Tax=Alteromonas sp. a30 TaxID=2730917 RepID=UPI00227D9AFC|nr:hypothetical protein [Alteromonas sp. a30]MCY7297300.1 hypothetical protein [Alteromonas sp. a30]